MRSLSDGGRDRVLVCYRGRSLRDLDSGVQVEIIHLRVCLYLSEGQRVGPYALLVDTHEVSDIREEDVAGIGNAADDIQRAVSLRIPAFQRRLDEIERTCALKFRRRRDDLFLETRRRCHKLESRSGGGRLLGGLVVERSGLICRKLVVISDVHLVREPVIVIARVSYAGQDLTGLRARDDR